MEASDYDRACLHGVPFCLTLSSFPLPFIVLTNVVCVLQLQPRSSYC